MEEFIGKLVFVRLRPFWDDLRRKHPAAHRMLSRASRVVFPWPRRVWMLVQEEGIATGLYFKLNPRFESGFLQRGPESLDMVLRDNLVPGAVFYDVGSHIGVFAISAARMLGRQGAVYAFEPDPENVQLIKENAARNSLPVEVVSSAAWKCSGQLRFAMASGSDPSRMGGHLTADETQSSTILVTAISLDDFSQEHRPPSFIKIDVEGAEAEVLEGARNTILRYRPKLLVEIHNDEAFRRVTSLLQEYGYDFHCLVSGERQFTASPKWTAAS